MKLQWKKLIICILIPIAVGGLAALITKNNFSIFDIVNKPPLSPPKWVFPVAWTVLYILMGIASYLVCISGQKFRIRSSLSIYGLQLAVNFFWSIIFFNMRQYLFSFIWLVFLLALIILTTLSFYRINKRAGYLLIPYIAWVAFAGYINFGVFILN